MRYAPCGFAGEKTLRAVSPISLYSLYGTLCCFGKALEKSSVFIVFHLYKLYISCRALLHAFDKIFLIDVKEKYREIILEILGFIHKFESKKKEKIIYKKSQEIIAQFLYRYSHSTASFTVCVEEIFTVAYEQKTHFVFFFLLLKI